MKLYFSSVILASLCGKGVPQTVLAFYDFEDGPQGWEDGVNGETRDCRNLVDAPVHWLHGSDNTHLLPSSSWANTNDGEDGVESAHVTSPELTAKCTNPTITFDSFTSNEEGIEHDVEHIQISINDGPFVDIHGLTNDLHRHCDKTIRTVNFTTSSGISVGDKIRYRFSYDTCDGAWQCPGDINGWAFDNVEVACAPPPSPPVDQCVELNIACESPAEIPPSPEVEACHSKNKPNKLSFSFTGGNCVGSNNGQKDFLKNCHDIKPNTPIPVGSIVMITDSSGTPLNDENGTLVTPTEKDFVITSDCSDSGPSGKKSKGPKTGSKGKGSGKDFGKYIIVMISNPNGEMLQHSQIHTSCSRPLKAGDIFGALTLQSAREVLHPCPSEPEDPCNGAIHKVDPFCDKSLIDSVESFTVEYSPSSCAKFEQKKKGGKKTRRRLSGTGEEKCVDYADPSGAAGPVYIFAFDDHLNQLEVEGSPVVPETNPNESGGTFVIKGPIEGKNLIIDACEEQQCIGDECICHGKIQRVYADVTCSQPLLGVHLASFRVFEIAYDADVTENIYQELHLQYTLLNPNEDYGINVAVDRFFEQTCKPFGQPETFELALASGQSDTVPDTMLIDSGVVGKVSVHVNASLPYYDTAGNVQNSALRLCDTDKFTTNVISTGGHDNCKAIKELTSLKWEYVGGGCGDSDFTDSEGKHSCTGGSVRTDTAVIETDTGFKRTVALNEAFGVPRMSKDLRISIGGGAQVLVIHTSCKTDLIAGERFGALKLVSYEGENGSVGPPTPVGECEEILR